MDSVNVQIRFSITGDDGTVFTDAIYMSPAEYQATTPDQLEAMKQARYTAWRETIQRAQSQPEADPIVELAGIDTQLDQLEQERLLKLQNASTKLDVPTEVVEQRVEEAKAVIQGSVNGE